MHVQSTCGIHHLETAFLSKAFSNDATHMQLWCKCFEDSSWLAEKHCVYDLWYEHDDTGIGREPSINKIQPAAVAEEPFMFLVVFVLVCLGPKPLSLNA